MPSRTRISTGWQCSRVPKAFTTRGLGDSMDPLDASLYQEMTSPSQLFEWAKTTLCREEDAACKGRLSGRSDTANLDLTWDVASGFLRLSWTSPLMLQDLHASSSSRGRTEVGILSKDTPPNQQPHELGLSGLLIVLGEKNEPSATMFSFPSRHRLAGQFFSSRFLQPAGLHPTLQIRVSSNESPVTDEQCAPFVFLSLPKVVFADRYQLADPLFLAAKNLRASRYTSVPVDLEAPAYTTEPWGSHLLLELAPPNSTRPESWAAEVPLHARYLEPAPRGARDASIPYPVVFWACESSANVDFANNPFDRSGLGYDGLFSKTTVFWHVQPQPAAGGQLVLPISVPVLTDSADSWVGLGTAAAIVMGLAWVLWRIAAAFAVAGYASHGVYSRKVTSSKKRV